MPTTPAGRLVAAGYVVAVLASTVSWLVQGASPTWSWITVLLTLPLGYLASGILAVLAMGTAALPEWWGWVLLCALTLVAFPGLAVANVAMGRAAFVALRNRCRGCRLLHRAAGSGAA